LILWFICVVSSFRSYVLFISTVLFILHNWCCFVLIVVLYVLFCWFYFSLVLCCWVSISFVMFCYVDCMFHRCCLNEFMFYLSCLLEFMFHTCGFLELMDIFPSIQWYRAPLGPDHILWNRYCCFSTKHAVLGSKTKDQFVWNQVNVSEWSNVSTCELLIQSASIQLT